MVNSRKIDRVKYRVINRLSVYLMVPIDYDISQHVFGIEL